MIRRVRRKFILISMMAVTLVVFTIMICVNAVNFSLTNDSIEDKLELIVKNGGTFPLLPPDPEAFYSPEAPYDTRYFSVTFRDDGAILKIDTSRIAAINSDEALAMGNTARFIGKETAYLKGYKFCIHETTEGTMYIFLDCNREISSLTTFAFSTLIVCGIGTLAVFVLVYIISGYAMRPIIDSYSKQKQFITNAGHDIRTPITVIEANTEILEMENGESEWTEGIKRQTRRLAELTDQLVALSRMEEREHTVKTDHYCISDAVYESVEPYKAMATAKNRNLSTKIADGVMTRGDEKEIRRLCTIMMDNSIKYSDDGGSISVELYATQRGKYLIFKNTVESIKKGKQDHLFDRFYRSEESRNSGTGGFGIGLSVAEAIVTAHGGRISATSPDGKSIVFTVVLP